MSPNPAQEEVPLLRTNCPHSCVPTAPVLRHPRRRGQVAIFLMMALVALTFLLFWNFDLGVILAGKSKAQNAGDAAALAAARWQGATLNLIGELNLFHIQAVVAGDSATAEAITNLQARLCFTGPLAGFYAAQLAAKNNRIPVDDDLTDEIRSHAKTVRFGYTQDMGDGIVFDEPFPGAWGVYADLLLNVAAQGIAAAPENARFYTDRDGNHMLLRPDFYSAISSRNWCWFWWNDRALLEAYTNYRYWPPLPPPAHENEGTTDCEIYGLGVVPVLGKLADVCPPEQVNEAIAPMGYAAFDPADTNLLEQVQVWYLYNPARWSDWSVMRELPMAGTVKPEYDYSGADASVRVHTQVSRLTPSASGGQAPADTILWTAAAKPFGHLELSGRTRPDALRLVLPAFRSVRLIPVDAASTPSGGGFDLSWRKHCAQHLDRYVEQGTGHLQPGCFFCSQLRVWEDRSFRRAGSDWLKHNSGLCNRPSGSGGHSGGTRRGH